MRALLEERVLIVEHSQQQAANLQINLQASGFYVIGSTSQADEAVRICADLEPTLVLMDSSLSGAMKGTEAARQIHRRFNIPVVFLTSSEEEAADSDTCRSWPYGYLLRGCQDQQLADTLKSVMRLSQTEKAAEESCGSVASNAPMIRVSEVGIYPLYSGYVQIDQRSVRLTPKEQKFLDLLGRNQGSVVSFERIFSEVWDHRVNGFQPLRILVHRLRRKLGTGDSIENVFEMGYRLNIMSAHR